MALGKGNIELDVSARLDTSGLVRQVREAESQIKPISLSLNDKGFSQPLGRITGNLDEFQKSLDASVARTLAFGASVAVLNSVSQAFKVMVNSAVEVEKSLADINVILNLTSQNLAKFSSDLFQVAKNTGQAFETVSEAAVELSRQGLGAEETIVRINDAMVLTRLSGMEAAKSVETLTAAVNSFGSTALTTTELVNKLATVDAAFAVSTEDLANALARAGSTAQGAKVNLDELLAAVTSVQQITARGGSVIGNAFKSIFTRIQRSGVREALEEIGVATTDAAGNIRGALDIISDYAGVYSTLTDAQKAYTDELVAGVFQINNFKALVKDLGSDYSVYERALSKSNLATDEAVKRNEQLQSTLASLINESAVNVKQLAASLGELVATPAIENLLKIFNKLSGALAGALEGEGAIKKIFEGIGKFIAGPGLIIITIAFVKLFKFITGQATTAIGQVFNIGSAKDKIADAEARIGFLLKNNYALYEAISSEALSHEKKEQLVLETLQQQNQAYKQQQSLISSISRSSAVQAQVSASQGNSSGFIPSGSRGIIPQASKGFVPNFANGVEGAIQSEKMAIAQGSGGASKSAKPKVLKNFPMGGGKKQTIVANTDEVIVPNYKGGKGSAIFNKKMINQAGGKPEGAIPVSRGLVPNFAKGKKGSLDPNWAQQDPFRDTASSRYGQQRTPSLDLESVVGGIGMIAAKGKKGSVDKTNPQLPSSGAFLGPSGVKDIINDIAGSNLDSSEKEYLYKRLQKIGKIKFSNIGVSSISELNQDSTNKLTGVSGAIDDIIGPYIAQATAAASRMIYTSVLGNEVDSNNLQKSTLQDFSKGDLSKIVTADTEGSIFEAAIRLGSKESSKNFGSNPSSVWDFEENSGPTADMKKIFFDSIGYSNIIRADAKRVASDTMITEVVEKAYQTQGNTTWMRDKLEEWHKNHYRPLVESAVATKKSSKPSEISKAQGFIPNYIFASNKGLSNAAMEVQAIPKSEQSERSIPAFKKGRSVSLSRKVSRYSSLTNKGKADPIDIFRGVIQAEHQGATRDDFFARASKIYGNGLEDKDFLKNITTGLIKLSPADTAIKRYKTSAKNIKLLKEYKKDKRSTEEKIKLQEYSSLLQNGKVPKMADLKQNQINGIQGIIGEIDAASTAGTTLEGNDAFFDLKDGREVKTVKQIRAGEILKKGINEYLLHNNIKNNEEDQIDIGTKKVVLPSDSNLVGKSNASGFIPNFAQSNIDRLSSERGGFWNPADANEGAGGNSLSQVDHFKKNSYGRYDGKLDLRSFFPKSGTLAIGTLFKDVMAMANAGTPYTQIDAGEIVGPRIPKMLVTAKKFLDNKRRSGLKQPMMDISGYFEPYDLFNTLAGNKKYYDSEKKLTEGKGGKFEPSKPGKGIKKASLSSKYVPKEEKALADSFKQLGLPVNTQDRRGGFREFDRYYLKNLPLFQGGFADGLVPNFEDESTKLEGLGKYSDIYDEETYSGRSLNIGYLSSESASGPQIFKNLLKQITGAAAQAKPFTEIQAGSVVGPRIPSVLIKAKRILDKQRARGENIPFMEVDGMLSPPARLLEKLAGKKQDQKREGLKSVTRAEYKTGEEKELLKSLKTLGLNPKSHQMVDLQNIPMLKNFATGLMPSESFYIPKRGGNAILGNEEYNSKQIKSAIMDVVSSLDSSFKPNGISNIASSYALDVNRNKNPFSKKILNSNFNFGNEGPDGNPFVPMKSVDISNALKGLDSFRYTKGKYKPKKIGMPKLKKPNKESSFYGSMSAALGFVPNFANALQDAISREKEALGSQGSSAEIYVDQDSRLKGSKNPGGLLVANKRDEPKDGSQGVDRAIANKIDPKNHGAARGMIPNFIAGAGMQPGIQNFKADQFVKEHNKLVAALNNYKDLPDEEVSKLGQKLAGLQKQMKQFGVNKFSNKQQSKTMPLMEQSQKRVNKLGEGGSGGGSGVDKANKNLSKSSQKTTGSLKKQSKTTKDLGQSADSSGMNFLEMQFYLQSGIQTFETAVNSLVPGMENLDLSMTKATIGGAQFTKSIGSSLATKLGASTKAAGMIGVAFSGLTVVAGALNDVYESGILKSIGIYDVQKDLIRQLDKDTEARKKNLDSITQNIEKIDSFAGSLTKFGELSGAADIDGAAKVLQEILATGGDIAKIDPDGYNKLIDSIGDKKAFNEAAEELKGSAQLNIDTEKFQLDLANAYKDINTQLEGQDLFMDVKNPFADAIDYGPVTEDLSNMSKNLVGALDEKTVLDYADKLSDFDSDLERSGSKIASMTDVFGELSPALQESIELTPHLADTLMESTKRQLEFRAAIIKAKDAFQSVMKETSPLNKQLGELSLAMINMSESSAQAISILSETANIQATSRVEDLQATKTVSQKDLIAGKSAGEARGAESLAANEIKNALKGFSSQIINNADKSGITLSEDIRPVIEALEKDGEVSPAKAIESLTELMKNPLTDPEGKKIAQATLDKLQAINQEQIAGDQKRAAQLQSQLEKLDVNARAALRSNVIGQDQILAFGASTDTSTAFGLENLADQIKILGPLVGSSEKGNEILNRMKESLAGGTEEKNIQDLASQFLKINAGGMDAGAIIAEIEKARSGDGAAGINFEQVALLEEIIKNTKDGGVAGEEEVASAAEPVISAASIDSLSTSLSETISASMAGILGIPEELTGKINIDTDIKGLASAVLQSSQNNEKHVEEYNRTSKEFMKAMAEPLKGVDFEGLNSSATVLEKATENLLEATKNLNGGSASGFIPNFSPMDPVARALSTEKGMGAKRPVVDSHPSVGTYVRDAATQPNFSAVRRDHPEGITQAAQNSRAIQSSTNSKGLVPNFYKKTLSNEEILDGGYDPLRFAEAFQSDKHTKDKINAALFGGEMEALSPAERSSAFAANAFAANVAAGVTTLIGAGDIAGKILNNNDDFSSTKRASDATTKFGRSVITPLPREYKSNRTLGPIDPEWPLNKLSVDKIALSLLTDKYTPDKYESFFNDKGIVSDSSLNKLLSSSSENVLKQIPSNIWGTRLVDFSDILKMHKEMIKDGSLRERVNKSFGNTKKLTSENVLKTAGKSPQEAQLNYKNQLELASSQGSFFTRALGLSAKAGKLMGGNGFGYDSILEMSGDERQKADLLLLGNVLGNIDPIFGLENNELNQRLTTIPGGGDFLYKKQFSDKLSKIYANDSSGIKIPIPLSITGKESAGLPVIGSDMRSYDLEELDSLISNMTDLRWSKHGKEELMQPTSTPEGLISLTPDQEKENQKRMGRNSAKDTIMQDAGNAVILAQRAREVLKGNINKGGQLFSRNPDIIDSAGNVKKGNADESLSFDDFAGYKLPDPQLFPLDAHAPKAGELMMGKMLSPPGVSVDSLLPDLSKLLESYYSSDIQQALSNSQQAKTGKEGADLIKKAMDGMALKKGMQTDKLAQSNLIGKAGKEQELKNKDMLEGVGKGVGDDGILPLEGEKGIVQEIQIPNLEALADKPNQEGGGVAEGDLEIRDKFYLALLTGAIEEQAQKDKDNNRLPFDERIKTVEDRRLGVVQSIKDQLIPKYTERNIKETGILEKQISALRKRSGTGKRSRELLDKKIKSLKERKSFFPKVLSELEFASKVYEDQKRGQANLYYSDQRRPFKVDGKTISSLFYEYPEGDPVRKFEDLKESMGVEEEFNKQAKEGDLPLPLDAFQEGPISAAALLAGNDDVIKQVGPKLLLAAQIRNQEGNKGDNVGLAFEQRYGSLDVSGKRDLMSELGLTQENKESINANELPGIDPQVFEDQLEKEKALIQGTFEGDKPTQYYLSEMLKGKDLKFRQALIEKIQSMGIPTISGGLAAFNGGFNLAMPKIADIPFLEKSDVSALMSYIRDDSMKDTRAEKAKKGIELQDTSSFSDLINESKEPKDIDKNPAYLNFEFEGDEEKIKKWAEKIYPGVGNTGGPFRQRNNRQGKFFINKEYGEFTPTEILEGLRDTVRNDQRKKSRLKDEGFSENPLTAARNVIGPLSHPKNEDFEAILNNKEHAFPDLGVSAREDASNFKNTVLSITDGEPSDKFKSKVTFPFGYTESGTAEPRGKGIEEIGRLMSLFDEFLPEKNEIKVKDLAKNKQMQVEKAKGFVPNFSKIAGEIAASKTAGYKTPVTPSQVKNISIPGVGRSTYNTQESVFKSKGMSQPFIRPPVDSKAAKPYAKKVQKKFNFNPYSSASADGFVPNFAAGIDAGKFDEATKRFSDSIGMFERFGSTLQETFSNVDFSSLSAASNNILEASKVFGVQSQNIKEAAGKIAGAAASSGGENAPSIDFTSLTDASSAITAGVSKLSEQLSTPISIDAGDFQTVVNDMKNIQLSVNIPDVSVNVAGVAGAASEIKNAVASEVEGRVRSALANQKFVTTAQINNWFGTSF